VTPFHLPASLSTPSLRLAAAASIILFGLGLAACGDDPKPAVQPCGGACAIGMQCDAITNTCVSIAGNNAGNNTTNNATNNGSNNATNNGSNNATNNGSNNATNNPTNNGTTNPPECAADTDCAAAEYCASPGLPEADCRPGCRDDASCAANAACNLDSRRCEPIEGYCDSDEVGADCPDGAFCCPRENYCDLGTNRCVAGCTTDAQCQFGWPCITAQNKCGCDANADCPDNHICGDHLCVPVPCSPDRFEPNDDLLSAEPLAPAFGGEQSVPGLKLCVGDSDFFTLWLLPGVEVSGHITLGDGDGNLRWTWNSPSLVRLGNGGNEEAFTFTTTEAGIYSLEVAYRGSGEQQRHYDLAYTLADAGVACDPDGAPSGLFSMGLEDQLLIGPASICPEQGDRYNLAMARPGQTLEVRLTRTDRIVQTEAEITIFDADDNVLGTVAGAGFNLNLPSTVVPTLPTVQVRVGGQPTPMGLGYRLTLVSGRGNSDDVCFDDADEANNTPETATPLLDGTSASKKLCFDDGVDFYALSPDAGASVALDLLYEGSAVPEVNLHLPDGRRIAGQATQCGAGNPCVRFGALSATATGDWLVEVRSSSANIDYHFEVTYGVACDPNPGRWTAGCTCVPDLRDAPFAAEPGTVPVALPHNATNAPTAVFAGTLCSTDASDEFPVWTPPGSGVTVQLTLTGGQGAATVEVRDETQAVIATAAAGQPLVVDGAPGFRRFVVAVRSDRSGPIGYQLATALKLPPTQGSCTDDRFESGERDAGFDLGPAYGQWVLTEPTVICGDDLDRFRFTSLQQGDSLDLTVRRLWSADDRRLTLRLYHRGQAPNSDVLVTEAQELGGLATISIPSLDLGAYIIEVDGVRTAPIQGTGYRLEANLRRPSAACMNEGSEPNETLAEAGALASGWNYGGVLCQGDEADVWGFDAAAGERVILTWIGPGGADVELLGPANTPVAGASPPWCGAGLECIAFGPVDVTAATAGRYGLHVRADLAFQSIPYRVDLTKAPLCSGPDWQAGCVCIDDANDPADTRDDAIPLPIAAQPQTIASQTLCGQSEDWFRFDGNAQNRRVTLRFDKTRAAALMLVEVYGGVLGNVLLEEFVAEGDLTFDNPTYVDLWVRVAHTGQGVGYDLTWQTDAIPSCGDDDYEPNDDPRFVSDFTSIGNTEAAVWDLGRLCGPSDADWYKIDYQGFEDDLIIFLDRKAVMDIPTDLYPQFADYVDDGIDTQAVEVDIFDADLSYIGGVAGVEQTLESTLVGLAFGTYYARVRLAQPIVNNAQPIYTLALQHQPGSNQNCPDDALEDNDTFSTAARLSFGEFDDVLVAENLVSCNGEFDTGDWYKVTLNAGEPLRLEVDATNLEVLSVRLWNPALERFDEAQVRTPCEGSSRCALIEKDIDASEDWFIEILRSNPTDPPRDLRYNLRLRRPQPGN